MVSFNTSVRQMTEMFQWPKCLSKKRLKCFREHFTVRLHLSKLLRFVKYCWFI